MQLFATVCNSLQLTRQFLYDIMVSWTTESPPSFE
nr:MAG TPA: hypothetical protein [Caudoviricetes sp.]